MAIDYEQLVAQLEAWTRSGEGRRVRLALKGLNFRRIPRSHALAIANQARRHDMSNLALHILNPLIRPLELNAEVATDKEKAEYAVSLLNIGARREAREILSQIDPRQAPQKLLFESFAHFGEWNYAAAIPWLKSYIEIVKGDPYACLVGQVNLVAAYVATQMSHEAQDLLERVLRETKSGGYHLLRGNALELSAQLFIHTQQFARAEKVLNEALELLATAQNWSDFLVRKWRAILHLYQTPQAAEVQEEIVCVKRDAETLGHWETLRECDFYLAILRNDEALFNRVYFGTPFEKYREGMRVKAPGSFVLPKVFTHTETEDPSRIFNLETGLSEDKVLRLKPNQLLHRFMQLILSDLYKPHLVGSVFSELFPGQYFDPETSPDRVYQLVRRFRLWNRRSGGIVEIGEKGGGYAAQIKFPWGVQVAGRKKDEHEGARVQCLRLEEKFGAQPFSAKQACEVLGISRSSFHRVADRGLAADLLDHRGQGPATLYQIKKSA